MRTLRFVGACLAVALVVVAGATLGLRRPAASGAPRQRHAVPRVAEKWRVEFDAEFVGLPATDQAGVVATVGGSEVVSVSRSGKVEWSTAVAGALPNAPRLDRDMVFVAAARAVVALRRADGAIAWTAPTTTTAEDNRANRPVVAHDVVVATAADGLVVGLDRTTGAQRWRADLPTASTAEPAAGGGALVPPVVVVVGVAEWRGLDPATGSTLWSGELGVFGTSSPVVYANGGDSRAAIATDEHVIAVDARTGAPAWSSPADQSELYQVPVIASNGAALLVPDHWGRLAAYDPHDGRRLWTVAGADTVAEFGEPVLVADRLVALPLDGHGPRLGSPRGSTRIKPPVDGHGVADLPGAGLVVTTAGGATNFVVLYQVRYR